MRFLRCCIIFTVTSFAVSFASAGPLEEAQGLIDAYSRAYSVKDQRLLAARIVPVIRALVEAGRFGQLSVKEQKIVESAALKWLQHFSTLRAKGTLFVFFERHRLIMDLFHSGIQLAPRKLA